MLTLALAIAGLADGAQQGEEFIGVGIRIETRYGQLLVVESLKGSPACRAGVRAGDRILQIGDQSTVGMSLKEAASQLQGPQGTSVTIILQSGDGLKRTVNLIRDLIPSKDPCVETMEEETKPPRVLLADFNGLEVNEKWVEWKVEAWTEWMRVFGSYVEVPKWRTVYNIGPFYKEGQAEVKDRISFDSVDPEGRRGVLAIQYRFMKPDTYAGYFWRLKGFNPLDYPLLTFYARGDGAAGFPERLKVEVKVPGVGWFYKHIEITDKWQEFILPLMAFERIEWGEGNTLEFVITIERGAVTKDNGVFYIDDISFTSPLLLIQKLETVVTPEQVSALQEWLAPVGNYVNWLENRFFALSEEIVIKDGELDQLSRRNLYLASSAGILGFVLTIMTCRLWRRSRRPNAEKLHR